MKKLFLILVIIFAVGNVFANNDSEVLEFKTKIGFTKGEDKILEHQFLEDGAKLLIIGEKNLQLWDVENAKLINSMPQSIAQFTRRGFVSSYVLLDLPRLLDWRPFVVEPHGKWILTVEKLGANQFRSAVVRDLQTLKQLAVLDLPNVSTEYVDYDEQKGEIMTFGRTNMDGAFASWRESDFSRKDLISVKDYKWHQMIRDEKKVLVGTGDTKFSWSALSDKQGDTLTLRDAKTGAIEKEFVAENLKPETSFQETTVSADENFLISRRNDRVFVWNINSGGKPKFEISNPNPKGDFSVKQIVDRKFIVVKIDGQIRVYDVAGSGAPLFSIAPKNAKEDLSFLQIVRERFVIVKAENKIRVYDTLNGNALKYELAPENPKDTTEFQGLSKDGKYIAVREDRKVSVIELAGDGKPSYEIVRDSESERFPTVLFIDDKNLLAIARVNNKEKKEPRTEFYDLTTGKIKFDAPFAIDTDAKFTSDDKYLYNPKIGSFQVWNLAAKRFYSINLETYTETMYDSSTQQTTSGETRNSEYVRFSPDFRYILRYGDDVTAVFDTETGKQIQTIFDSEKVKYNKNNQIKKSGLGDAGWINNGKYVYAFESGSFFFGEKKTISLWEVKK